MLPTAQHLKFNSGIDCNNVAFLLQGVFTMDVHPSEDPMFPTSIFPDPTEGKTTPLEVQDEGSNLDENVIESHRTSE